MHLKNAKPNSISRNSRVAKKNPFVERGPGNWFIGAYRLFNLLKFVYDNFDKLKAFLESFLS